MANEFENVDFSTSWNKIGYIIWHRKYWILLCYFVVISVTVFLTVTDSKIYTSEALILINKNSTTNLSDINPFTVSALSPKGGTVINLGVESLDSEMEVMKSPLVMNQVIQENNLKYASGENVGEFLDPDNFSWSSLEIENIPKTSIIKISYSSTDPKLSYNIVNSLINNYQVAYEEINYKKATKDREFLEETYNKTLASLEDKYKNLGQESNEIDNRTLLSLENSDLNLEIISKQDKRLQKVLSSMPSYSISNKRSQLEIQNNLEKLKMLKEKYEWSVLVEQMSKNTSNIFVIKKPRLLGKDEYLPKKWIPNILVALLISFTLSCFVVYGIEKASTKVTFADIDIKSVLINEHNIDWTKLITTIMLKNIDKINLISLADEDLTDKFMDSLIKSVNKEQLEIVKTTTEDNLSKHLENIGSSEYIILLSQVGYSERKILSTIKNACKDLKKTVLGEYIFNN